MGYSIVYKKQFLKTQDDMYIPLVLAGSNNTYDTRIASNGRRYERRCREWTTIMAVTNDMIAFTEKALLSLVQSTLPSDYNEHFMFNGKWVDDEGLIKFMKNGIKSAKTIEELSEMNSFKIEMKAYVLVSEKKSIKHNTEISMNLTNSEELDQFLLQAEHRLNKRASNEDLSVCIEFRGEDPIPYPLKKRTKKSSNKEKPDCYWTIMRQDGHYLQKLHRGGANLSRIPVKVFKTKEKAEKYIEEYYLNSRFNSGMKYQPKYISSSDDS